MKKVILIAAVLALAVVPALTWPNQFDTTDVAFQQYIANHAGLTDLRGKGAVLVDSLRTAGTMQAGNISVAKISNGTSAINVGSDSLMITPEGGIAILAKSKYANKLYKGMLVTNDTIGFNMARSTTVAAVVYSDSIAANAFGYFVISGRAKAAFDTAFSIVLGNVNTYAVANCATNDSGRVPNVVAGLGQPNTYFIGYVLNESRGYLGINGRRDSLAYIIVQPSFTQSEP